jgi:excisionase family DNA binding protein
MAVEPFDNYLDLVDAARILGIHPQSLRRLIKQKKVPAVLFAGKYLIERDKLEMFKSNYDPRPGRKAISVSCKPEAPAVKPRLYPPRAVRLA